VLALNIFEGMSDPWSCIMRINGNLLHKISSEESYQNSKNL
jgi:hypothetical protein